MAYIFFKCLCTVHIYSPFIPVYQASPAMQQGCQQAGPNKQQQKPKKHRMVHQKSISGWTLKRWQCDRLCQGNIWFVDVWCFWQKHKMTVRVTRFQSFKILSCEDYHINQPSLTQYSLGYVIFGTLCLVTGNLTCFHLLVISENSEGSQKWVALILWVS